MLAVILYSSPKTLMKTRDLNGCPISYSLDIFGDKWTLLVMRDVLGRNMHYYRDFLKAGEGIATNVLSDRLKTLVEQGIVVRREPTDGKGQVSYHATEKGMELLPILHAMIDWGKKYQPRRL